MGLGGWVESRAHAWFLQFRAPSDVPPATWGPLSMTCQAQLEEIQRNGALVFTQGKNVTLTCEKKVTTVYR